MLVLLIVALLISLLFPVYSEGDVISDQHQQQVYDVCAGGMTNGFGLGEEDIHSLSLGEYAGKVIWINFSASWWGPCFNHIQDGDDVYEHYINDSRVVITTVFYDAGQPWSCSQWNDYGSSDGPPIIDAPYPLTISGTYSDNPNLIYNWFSCETCALPMNVFIDHNMSIHTISEVSLDSNSIISIIDGLISSMPSCDDEAACNTGDSSECIYAQTNYDCSGNCIVEVDCAGECNGSAALDQCGVCNGDNSTCTDCNDVINGEAYLDGCFSCVGGDTGLEPCPKDCNGYVGGLDGIANNGDEAYFNECEDCVYEEDSNCIKGCDGIWSNDGNHAVVDQCGVCAGNDDCNLSIELNNFPTENTLVSIYPNPFNPNLNIRIFNKSSDFIKIEVYNISGKKIDTIYNGFASSGYHLYTWHADRINSGVYFIVISDKTSIISEKVILLK